MSVSTLDYIPFDYQRYFQEILPAFEQATRGNFILLKALLDSATQIADSVRTRYAVPLSGDEGQHFLGNRFETNIASLLNVSTLRRVRAGGAWNPWDALAIVLPTLQGRTLHHLGRYGELLKSFLLATLCCQCPPWSANWSQRSNGPIIPHDEVLFDWQTYTTRDEHMQQLWSVFDQPLPPEIIPWWSSWEDKQNEHHPRTIFYTLGESLTGFITHEEAEQLLQQVRTHERPAEPGFSIISECIRDGEARNWNVEIEELPPGVAKCQEDLPGDDFSYRIVGGKYITHRDLFMYWKQKHPTEIEHFLQQYYQQIWTVEEEILYRMRFAAERGWGMLKVYSN